MRSILGKVKTGQAGANEAPDKHSRCEEWSHGPTLRVQEFLYPALKIVYNPPTVSSLAAPIELSRCVTDANVSDVGRPFPATSLSLLERARANDPTAWQRIVFLYSPLVYAWCRRFGLQDADTLDVGQDVLRSVFANLACFRRDQPSQSFRRWIKTITRNKALDAFRRAKRRPTALGGSDAFADQIEDSTPPADDSDASEVVSERKLLLRRALDLVRGEVEPNTWEAFWRVTVDEKPAAEVAAALRVSANVVYLSKSRVLRRLTKLFADLIEDVR